MTKGEKKKIIQAITLIHTYDDYGAGMNILCEMVGLPICNIESTISTGNLSEALKVKKQTFSVNQKE